MRFRYSRAVTAGVLEASRPYLDCGILGPRSDSIRMLVDSGADETLLPLTFLTALGVQFEEETCEMVNWSGGSSEGRVTSVVIEFGGGKFSFRSRAVAHEAVAVPVLGNREFFDRYVVTFDGGRGLFHVEEPQPIRAIK